MKEDGCRAFLIGAGATKAQYGDAPLSDDFFKILKSRQGNPNIRESLNNMIRLLNRIGINTLIENYNLEELMIEVHNKTVNEPHLERAFHSYLYTEMYEMLANPTGSTIYSIRQYLEGRRVSTIFRNLLVDSRLDYRDFFLTLNYDLYLVREVISINQGFIDYGLSSKNVIPVHYQTNIGRLDMKNNSRRFSVYHLHGSLNWELTAEDRLRVHLLNAVPPQQIRNKEGFNVLIVPPGKKAITGRDEYLQSVWSTARSRLITEARELIIIGSSLNPQDKELIGLIEEFINVRSIENVKIIYKKSDAQRQRYLEVLGRGFREYDGGFDEKSFSFIFDNKNERNTI